MVTITFTIIIIRLTIGCNIVSLGRRDRFSVGLIALSAKVITLPSVDIFDRVGGSFGGGRVSVFTFQLSLPFTLPIIRCRSTRIRSRRRARACALATFTLSFSYFISY